MSNPKEIHYFGRSDPLRTRSWYESHFEDAEEYDAIGEGSTSYTHPDIVGACASEIADACPDARLIYMVRNPLRRLESDWKMRKREGWAPDGSINAAATVPETNLIRHGMYWSHLSTYRSHFSDEQLLVVFLEDVQVAPEKELERCFAHLGVAPDRAAHEEAAVRRNRADHFRRDRLGAGWLRRTGLISLSRDLAPRPLFNLAKSVLTRPEHYDVDWDPDVKRGVVEALRDDSRSLLRHCGKPATFWVLD